MIPWHIEFELTHAPTRAEAEAIAFAMLGAHRGVQLKKVQSKISHEIGREEWEAKQRDRKAVEDEDDGA